MSTRFKILIFSLIGLAAFIFFGLFFPILILPKPVDLAQIGMLLYPPKPTIIPLKTVLVSGQEIIDRGREYFEPLSDSVLIRTVRCTKPRIGVAGSCSESDSIDILPAYLIDLYTSENRGSEIANTLLSSCVRNHNICKAAFPVFYRLYRETADVRYRNALEIVGTELISSHSRSAYRYLQDIEKLLLLSQVTSDPAFFDEALKRFENVNQVRQTDTTNQLIFEDEELGDIRRFDCGLYGAVMLTLFKETRDSNILAKSRRFFELLPKLEGKYEHLGAVDLCLDGLGEMAKITGENQFKSARQNLIAYTLHAYWDSEQTPKFSQDAGFVLADYQAAETNQVLNFKMPTEQAWFLAHVVEFPDSTFKFLGSNL